MEACCVSLYYTRELLRQEFLKRPTFTQVRNIAAGYREYVNKKLPAIETWDEEVWERCPYSESAVDETVVFTKGKYRVTIATTYIDEE